MKKKKLKKFFLSSWPFLLIILVFFLRTPSLFEPFVYADEGIYLTLGQAFKKGLVLYRDIYDNKPPLIYLLASFASNFFNYRLILFLWSLATIFVFYRLAQFLFAKNRFSVLLSASVFAILTSLPTFEGNIANAENFMLLPTIAGFYLILKFLGHTKTKFKFTFTWLLAGILFCLAVLFKVPAIFDFLAALLVCLLFTDQKGFKVILSRLLFLLVGFLIPIIITFIYFGFKNSLTSYLQAAFFQNLLYLSSWGNQVGKVSSLPIGLLTKGGLLLLIILILFLFRQKISLSFKTIILWFFTSLFAALLSSRPYPHYLLQILPAFSLSCGLLSLSKIKIWLKLLPGYFSLILIWIFISFHFWYYPNLPYFKNFYQFAFKIKSRQEYLNYFDHQAGSLYQTAAFLRSHSEPQEKIFVWGVKPSIYALTHRLPVGRYTVSYHIIDLHSYEETINSLKQSPPRWLVWAQDEKASFPQLQDFVENNYVPFQQIGNMEIFYRLPKISRL